MANETAEQRRGDIPRWGFAAALRSLFHPAMYRMVLFIYIPFLIPTAVGIIYFGTWLDGKLGWDFLPGAPWNAVLFGVFLAAGLTLVWWCYSYIIIVGEGGPAPLVAPPAKRLVFGGPYGLSRHPSVAGKVLGVVAVALLLRSHTFLCVLLPVGLTISLLEKYFMMEKRDVKHFGPVYAEYVSRVPFFIPRIGDIIRLIREGDRDVPVLELSDIPGSGDSDER